MPERGGAGPGQGRVRPRAAGLLAKGSESVGRMQGLAARSAPAEACRDVSCEGSGP